MDGLEQRLLDNLTADEGHLLWTGGRDKDGYGKIWDDGKMRRAHRVAWELSFGEIPVGVMVLHKNVCHTPPCANPLHLYLGDNGDNQRDAVQLGTHPKTAVTRCPQGHPYDEENTRHTPQGRACLACDRIGARGRRRRGK